MAYGVSYRIAPAIRYYSTGGSAVALAFVIAAIYAYLWMFAAIAVAAGCLAVVVLAIARSVSEKRHAIQREADLLSCSVSPRSVVAVGRKTNPPTFGVYCVETFASGRRSLQYRVGNHPVRQAELTREFGAAGLLALFESRADAEEYKYLLATGQARPPEMLET
jgi:hypothetical protein